MEPLHPNRNRSESPSSVGARVPERLPRRAVRGFGGRAPIRLFKPSGKRFVGLTGFPERQQQNSELSGHSDNGPLLALAVPSWASRSP